MTTRDTSGDAMEAFLRGPDVEQSGMTLSGSQLKTIRDALENAEAALRQAETSKVGFISRTARAARSDVLYAWAIVRPGAKR